MKKNVLSAVSSISKGNTLRLDGRPICNDIDEEITAAGCEECVDVEKVVYVTVYAVLGVIFDT